MGAGQGVRLAAGEHCRVVEKCEGLSPGGLTFPMTCLWSCWDRVLKLELGSPAGAGVWVHRLRSQQQRRR